jgi:hypothetical protein
VINFKFCLGISLEVTPEHHANSGKAKLLVLLYIILQNRSTYQTMGNIQQYNNESNTTLSKAIFSQFNTPAHGSATNITVKNRIHLVRAVTVTQSVRADPVWCKTGFT